MFKEKIVIPSIYEKVSDVCYSLRAFCFTNDIDKKISGEMELCLTEALNNVIKHAYKEDPTKEIEISFSKDDKKLSITIEDTGIPGKNFKKIELVFDPTDVLTLPEGGMGLFIINSLMDTVGYERKGDRNFFVMKKLL